MSEPFFTGVCTALVTPFIYDKINYPMVQQLIQRQIDAGVSAVVLCGTTGEAPTLSDSEKLELLHRCITFAQGGCKILLGTGSNSTAHAVALSKAAQEAGADGLLVVSPYYNKANEEGLYTHFSIIAKSVDIPIVLYNVPGRTGLDIPISVYQKLSQIPNIAGVKEASSDIAKVAKILAYCPDHFSVWTGNDEMTLPVIALGGKGVISVASNVCPKEMVELAGNALSGDHKTAIQMQRQLQPLMEMLFCEVNPIPVKYAMKCIGYDCGKCRLPLTELTQANKEKIRYILQ